MQQPIQQAIQQNIKVVLVDPRSRTLGAASAIASDNLGGGKAAFDAIHQLAPRRQGAGGERAAGHQYHR